MNEKNNNTALVPVLAGLITGAVVFILSFYSYKYESLGDGQGGLGFTSGAGTLLFCFFLAFIGGVTAIISAQPKSTRGRRAVPIIIGVCFSAYFGFIFLGAPASIAAFGLLLVVRIWLTLAFSYLFGTFFSSAAANIQKR